jgi:hypothetical protein
MYNKYYTSEIMALCLYSNKTLEEMIKLVESLFKDVPKKENFEMPKYDLVKPYDEKILSNFYKIVPIKDKDKLVFRFYFPFCDKHSLRIHLILLRCGDRLVSLVLLRRRGRWFLRSYRGAGTAGFSGLTVLPQPASLLPYRLSTRL